MTCETCKYWAPHIYYNDVGICKLHGLQFSKGMCSDYKDLEIEKDKFYWCSKCKTDVYSEEAYLHKGHNLYSEVYEDPESHTETYAAD